MARSSRVKAALRRLEVRQRLIDGGDVHYAELTPVGSVLDNTRSLDRAAAPLVLEQYLPRIKAWQVVETFPSWDQALPRAKKAKGDRFFRHSQLRLRDRRSNDILLCDIL